MPDELKPNQTDKPSKTSAAELLQRFLQEHNIVIKLTPPQIRQITDGALLIEKASIIADYESSN